VKKAESSVRRALTVAMASAIVLFAAAPSFTRPEQKLTPVPVAKPGAEEAPKNLTPDQIPRGALVPAGPPPTITVMGTGDVIGYIEPCG